MKIIENIQRIKHNRNGIRLSRGDKEISDQDLDWGERSSDEWSLFLPKYQRMISDLYSKVKKHYTSIEVKNQEIPINQGLNKLDISKNMMKKYKPKDSL